MKEDFLAKAGETILEQLDSLAVLDHEGRYVYLNDRWVKSMGYTREEAIGRYARELVPETRVHEVYENHEAIIGHVVQSDGKMLFVSYYPVFIEGSFSGVIIHVFISGLDMATDFSNMVQALRCELEEYKRQLTGLCDKSYIIGRLVGKSPAMEQLKERIFAAARTNSTVIIEGETGTGKELVARAIHDLSCRKDGRLVRVNCSAIPLELMESEFFGYEEGAFTGARKGGKIGKFELAHNGTLFLDEINHLPITMQPKFLRVVQEKEVERVGSRGDITPIDIRLIAATNMPLESMVEEETFRRDLFYRLNVIKIRVPPLRERISDIPILTYHFITNLNSGLDLYISKVDDEVLDAFAKYHWPGNVRELQNVIERAMNNAYQEDILRLNHFEGFFSPIGGKEKAEEHPLRGLNREEELAIIRRTLDECGGNKVETARRLGISRTVLYKKLKRYEFI